MIAALRYGDTFVNTDGERLFAERKLYVNRLEERALSRWAGVRLADGSRGWR